MYCKHQAFYFDFGQPLRPCRPAKVRYHSTWGGGRGVGNCFGVKSDAVLKYCCSLGKGAIAAHGSVAKSAYIGAEPKHVGL